MFAPPDFLTILRAAQSGETRALEELLQSLHPFLESLARGYADPDADAASTADLVQESWLRAWKNLKDFRAGAVEEEALIQFRAWISTIVHRLGLNAQRARQAQKRRPQGPAASPVKLQGRNSAVPDREIAAIQTSPSQRASRNENAQRVHQALGSVPDPLQREVLFLRFFEGLDLKKVASRLGITYDRARKLFAAGLRVMEAHLQERPSKGVSAR